MLDLAVSLTLLVACSLAVLVALSPARLRWMSPPVAILVYLGFYYLAQLIFLQLGGRTISGWAFDPEDMTRSTILFAVLSIGFGFGYLLGYRRFPSQHPSEHRLPGPPNKRATGIRLANACILVGMGAALWMLANDQLRLTYVLDPVGVRVMETKFLLNFLDLLIPGVLLRIHYLRGSPSMWATVLILIAVTVLFVAAGSRYRLGVLYTALGAYWLLTNPTKLKFVFAICATFAAVTAVGLLGITRQYRGGINVSNLESADPARIMATAFNETSSVSAAGALVDYVPSKEPYVYLAPVENALLQFVPRIVWPDKPYPEYLGITWRAAGAGTENFGLALPLHGELYLMFGYAGVLVVAAILGFALRRIWSRIVAHQLNAHAALLFAIIPLVLSRGYLAQVLTSLIFIMGPMVFVRATRRRQLPSDNF